MSSLPETAIVRYTIVPTTGKKTIHTGGETCVVSVCSECVCVRVCVYVCVCTCVHPARRLLCVSNVKGGVYKPTLGGGFPETVCIFL